MKHVRRAIGLLLGWAIAGAVAAPAAAADSGGGGFELDHVRHLSDAQRAAIWSAIRRNQAELRGDGRLAAPQPEVAVPLDWPLAAAPSLTAFGYHGISNFVDQNPAFPDALLDYECGARSYDLSSGYNHQGIDFFTWPWGWHKMDDDQVEVVAAAPGTIIFKQDGNPDRSCGFGGGGWNAVYVQHADGSVAWYGHMKNGSTTAKGVGAAVVAGEYLGVVGSSGNSTGPHLHLELYDAAMNLQEPYAGPCNVMNPSTAWWRDQRPYYDAAINELMTGFAAAQFQPCPNPAVRNDATVFQPGDTVYFTRFYRDQRAGQASIVRILRPDRSVFDQWTHAFRSPPDHYAASWWWNSRTIGVGEPLGQWTFDVTFEGVTYEHRFWLGQPVDILRGETMATLAAIAQASPQWTDPEPVLGPSAPPLLYYQVEPWPAPIYLSKDGASIVID